MGLAGVASASPLGVVAHAAMPLRPRPPKRGRSRWVGFLYCLNCEAELREVMADENNDTYLLDGGDRLKRHSVPCRDCGAVREFRSHPVRPMPPENIVDRR